MPQPTVQPFDSQNALAQSDAFLCPYGRLPGGVIRLVVQGELVDKPAFIGFAR